MSANFSVQFRINEKTQTRVIRLTDTSSGFTLAKGNFSLTFPDGSTRIKTEWASPDITSPAAYIDILAVTDNSNNIITGSYKIDFIALDAATTSYSASKTFDFNWVKPTNGITNLSDVLIPEVKFQDATSYSPIGSFTGTLARTLSASFPSTSEAAGGTVSSVSSNLIDIVSSGKYYDGTYTPTSDVLVNYTHSSNSWLTINYVELFTKTFLIKRCPTQIDLINKINTYRGVIEAYKEKNDTQFNILSEQYDLAIALYSHIIARYETSTQDGSEGQLRELLSILEPYSASYTPQLTRMLPFELAATGSNSFNISDGTNVDNVQLGGTLTFSSGNPALTIGVSNNLVTYTPTFGTAINTFAQGNDSRFHNAVTIGTSNGLSLASQVLSLAAATSSTSGAMSAADKAKLDGIAAGANVGTVTSVGISVPSAFTVSNSPVTTSGTINISATGNPLQYITGAGALATLNTGAVPESGNLYFTNTRARAAISVSGSLSYNSTTGVISYTTPSETDPIFVASPSYGITNTNISNWNTAYGWGNHASAGYLTSFTETDPIYVASSWYSTTNNSSNWNTAYGWGNHALAGYLTSISSSQVTTALGYTPENAANKGIANGYASLDGGGLIPSSQLPSYVDDVLEYADLAGFPATGVTGKIYVALDTNKIYRWSGSAYIEVSPTVGTIWGGITGTLSNQTDLQAALNAKQNTLTNPVTGTGTTNTLAKFTGTSAIGNSNITDTGSLITLASNTTISSGGLQIGSNTLGFSSVRIGKNLTGSTTISAITSDGAIQSDVTSDLNNFVSGLRTAASTFTLGSFRHFQAIQSSIGAGSAITNQYGFEAASSLTGATNNFGFYGNIASGTGRWNIYMSGTANNYMAGSLGIGGLSFTGSAGGNLFIGKAITGNVNSNAVSVSATIQSDVTGVSVGYYSSLSTQASAFTISEIRHYQAAQGTIGAGSTVTNQYGFWAAGLTGATNNFGFYGNIASGTGRWNLYMNGTANNYLAGSLGVGTTAVTAVSINVGKTITGGTTAVGIQQQGAVQSDVTAMGYGIVNGLSTQATAFTITHYQHFAAIQNTIGAGSTVTNQYGFRALSSLTGATNNYGFFGDIAAGTNRWNIYMNGTAQNYLAGALSIGVTTANASALLQVDSTTQGFLPPRMTATQRGAIASPAEGLVVVQTDGVKGLYIYIDAAWHALTML